MKRKKIIALLLTLCMTSSVFVGCGTKKEETGDAGTEESDAKAITLTVWGPQEDQAPLEGYDKGILPAMCDKFNEEHPEWDITFEYGVCSEGDAKDVVTKDVDAAADVYMFANDQIPVLAEAGAIAKLGGQTAEDIKANNPESMTTSVTYNDGIYGVPFTSNTWFMYYDPVFDS